MSIALPQTIHLQPGEVNYKFISFQSKQGTADHVLTTAIIMSDIVASTWKLYDLSNEMVPYGIF